MYNFDEARRYFTRFHEHPVLTCASDFETTGINLKHGDRPFMLAATLSTGKQHFWQAEVEPLTRKPLWSADQLDSIQSFHEHRDWTYVMTNSKFDTRCIKVLCPKFKAIDFLCRCHDTVGEHHLVKNNESHALKDGAALYCDIPDDDEHALHAAVKVASHEAAKLGWALASPSTCPYVRKRPKKGWGVMDMWVPRQLALYYWRTSEAYDFLAAQTLLQTSLCVDPASLNKLLAAARKLSGWEWHPPEFGYDSVHPWHTLAETYCRQDTVRTLMLHTALEAELKRREEWDIYLEMRVNIVNSYIIEENGVTFNHRKAKALRKVLDEESSYAEGVVSYTLSPVYSFNPRSPLQVRRVLYKDFGLPVSRLTKSKRRADGSWSEGNPTTDKDFLAELIDKVTTYKDEDGNYVCIPADLTPPTRILDDPQTWRKAMIAWHRLLVKDKDYGRIKQLYLFCASLLQYSKSNKNVSQIDGFLSLALRHHKTGFSTLFQSINPYGTKTVRQSSSNPNGTNVSKGGKTKKSVAHLWKTKQSLRLLFGPPPGYEWWSVDYSKIQPMIFCVMSGTTSLLEAMISGDDPYNFLARIIFGHCTDPTSPDFTLFSPEDNPIHAEHRDIGKTVLLAFLFGAQKAKLEQASGMPGLYSILENKLPTAIEFLDRKEHEVRTRGYVTTLGGYRLYVPEDKAYSGVVYAVQGTEGEIVKTAECGVQHYISKRKLGRDFYVTLPVHDELNYAARLGFGQQHIGAVCQIMVDAAALYGVPAKVGIKYCPDNWGTGEKWEEELI